MKPVNKKLFILIIVLILIIFAILLLRFFLAGTKQPPAKSPTPSQAPNSTPVSLFSPTPAPPKPLYNPDSLEKDFERISERGRLSNAELQIRQRLLDSIGNKSGIITQNNTFKVEYLHSPDVFTIEILTTDTDLAKRDALNYFKGQGLTAQGICDLPIVFYLSPEVSDYFRQSNLEFNPVPEGC
jgi:hypothetical protein